MIDMLVPLWARVAAVALLAVGCLGLGWVEGAQHAEDRNEARRVVEERQAQAEIARLAAKGSEVVLQYVDRVKTVEGATRVITKEIPRYVTPTADAGCTVPAGFIRLLDADPNVPATLYQPAAGPVDAPSGVALSTVAGYITEARRRFELNSAQCVALQDWARSLQ